MNKSRKLIVIGDPGLDGAVALAMALASSNLEVVAALATAGNIGHEQATKNMQAVLGRLDPARWPRLGIAPLASYELDGKAWHGSNGLHGLDWPSATPLNAPTSDRLLVELARKHPGELSLLNLGPCTVLAQALDREPALPELLSLVVLAGGAWRDSGNSQPGVEFHFHCDPDSARKVLHSGFRLRLVPLDASRPMVISPAMMTDWGTSTQLGGFLAELMPHGLRHAQSSLGIEGVPVEDVAALVALEFPEACTLRPMAVDIETKGEISRGMSIFDTRRQPGSKPNAEVVLHIDPEWFQKTLASRVNP